MRDLVVTCSTRNRGPAQLKIVGSDTFKIRAASFRGIHVAGSSLFGRVFSLVAAPIASHLQVKLRARLHAKPKSAGLTIALKRGWSPQEEVTHDHRRGEDDFDRAPRSRA